MGSYDGPKVCELVGLLILNQLSQLVDVKNISLYRDDGLAIQENTLGPILEQIKKKIIKLFYQHSLYITAKTNLVQTKFLDVTFNLKSGKYWLYRKPNNQPLFVHQHSNHPPTKKNNYHRCLLIAFHCFHTTARNSPELSQSMKRLCKEVDIPVSCSKSAHPALIKGNPESRT